MSRKKAPRHSQIVCFFKRQKGCGYVSRAIQSKDKLNPDDVEFYEQIDGLRVIEELLVFKGLGVIRKDNTVPIKLLEEVAHIHYRLKCGATNKLYVGWYLDRFYKRSGLQMSAQFIYVPAAILAKVKEEEAKYPTNPDLKFA